MTYDIIMTIAATIFGGIAAYKVVKLGQSFAVHNPNEPVVWGDSEEYFRWQEMQRL